MATKLEWESTKKQFGNRCAICKLPEKKIGELDKAHLKARTKGGQQVIPMCPNCHCRYDRQLLGKVECQRIGVDYVKYVKGAYAPRKARRKTEERWSLF